MNRFPKKVSPNFFSPLHPEWCELYSENSHLDCSLGRLPPSFLVNSHRVLQNKLAQYNTEIIQRRTGKEKKKRNTYKGIRHPYTAGRKSNQKKQNKTKKKQTERS